MSGKISVSGPYRATKLWNDAVRSFYNGMPVSRHWRGLRQYDRCFTASEAVDWLHLHLQANPNFGRSVSRDQTTKLLRKFFKSGLIEDVRGSVTRPEDFRDGRELYRFSNRSPLKALRTPRTPGRVALATLDPNTPGPDQGGSPLLRRRTRGSLRESVRSKKCIESEEPANNPPKARPRRTASLHRGDNAANEQRDQGGMQECHLVAKPPTKDQTSQVWKQVLLSKLDSVCERLVFGDAASVLEPGMVCGETVHHNMTQLSPRGVVRVEEGHPEDLPNWILTAMKCMARWPNMADPTCNIPNYPGVERDVFKIVRDFFTNLMVPLIPFELYEPLIRMYIGAEFLDITHRSPPPSDSSKASTTTSSSSSSTCSPPPKEGNQESEEMDDSDSVDNLILNMSLCGQKTSTPNTDQTTRNGERHGEGRVGGMGSSRIQDLGPHTPLHGPFLLHPNSSFHLRSLKLCRLKEYTDFKDDSLYPAQQQEGSYQGSPAGCLAECLQNIAPYTELRQSSKLLTEHPQKTGAYAQSQSRGPNTEHIQNTGHPQNTPPYTHPHNSRPHVEHQHNTEYHQNLGPHIGHLQNTLLHTESPDPFRPVSRQSRASQDQVGSRGPETVRSIKTNDHARRMRRGQESAPSLDALSLPHNCCFETAFTSDSPQTRIIPQKSVDSLHFQHEERPRPRSIATAPEPRPRPASCAWDVAGNASTVSDLFRSSIMSSASTEYVTAPSSLSPLNRSRSAGNLHISDESTAECRAPPHPMPPPRSLASRIRDSIKRKHIRDDSFSRRRGNSNTKVDRVQGKAAVIDLQHLRTESGGYLNLGLASHASGDTDSMGSSVDREGDRSRLAHLRTKSGGFLNLALMPSSDSMDTMDSGPPTSRSDSALLDHHQSREHPLLPPPGPLNSHRTHTPDGCLSHSILSSASGCSVYHSALSHTSRNCTPTFHTSQAVPPLQPVSGMAGLYSSSLSQGGPPKPLPVELPTDTRKQLSSSANELSDGWADRTPYGQAPPFARGGVWRLYHASPSKKLISRRRGTEVFWGSKACLPGLLTRAGKEAAVTSMQLLLLLLAPVARKKLHLLLRMMSKMAANDKLTLDPDLSTRALVLNTFTRSILLCAQEADYDEVLSLRVVSFLMDNHEEVLRPPQDLTVLAHRRLALMQRSQVVYASTVEERGVTLTYCRQVTSEEYQRQRLTGSQLFLSQLLDQILDNNKLSAKERKKKLKEFKSLYPEVYRARFPEEQQKVEGKSKMKSLIKLASLTSLGKSRQMRV